MCPHNWRVRWRGFEICWWHWPLLQFYRDPGCLADLQIPEPERPSRQPERFPLMRRQGEAAFLCWSCSLSLISSSYDKGSSIWQPHYINGGIKYFTLKFLQTSFGFHCWKKQLKFPGVPWPSVVPVIYCCRCLAVSTVAFLSIFTRCKLCMALVGRGYCEPRSSSSHQAHYPEPMLCRRLPPKTVDVLWMKPERKRLLCSVH